MLDNEYQAALHISRPQCLVVRTHYFISLPLLCLSPSTPDARLSIRHLFLWAYVFTVIVHYLQCSDTESREITQVLPILEDCVMYAKLHSSSPKNMWKA